MILELLAAEDDQRALKVADLAGRCERSPRQIRTALAALEGRGLVVLARGYLGWGGAGEYGPLRLRAGGYEYGSWDDRPRGLRTDLPVALTAKKGEPAPVGNRSHKAFDPAWIMLKDCEFVRTGMPTYGLWVSLPLTAEEAERREARYAESVARARAMLG
jgi:hypothetical protein